MTEAVADTPRRLPSGPEWVCTNCGSPGGQPIPARPSLDPRYAIGYCNTCSKDSPERKTPRPTNQLVHIENFNRQRWQVDKDTKELKALVQEFAAGKDKVRLTGPQVVRLIELFDRYGFPGFVPNEALRADAADYLQGELKRKVEAKRPKTVKSRGA